MNACTYAFKIWRTDSPFQDTPAVRAIGTGSGALEAMALILSSGARFQTPGWISTKLFAVTEVIIPQLP